jgi:hypothetical protein
MIDERRPHVLTLLLAATLAMSQLPACLGDRCGPDQVLVDTVCMSADAGPEAGPADGPAGDAEGDATGPSVPVGGTCTDQPDCVGETNVCIIVPGAPSGYCSIQGCTMQPDSCPQGYVCTDLTAFVPGLLACLQA